MPRELVEASVLWGGELFAVKYFALGERVVFDDVPQTPNIEVRTRVVEAPARMPRNGWDVPYGAIALAATFCQALVVVSIGGTPALKPAHAVELQLGYAVTSEMLPGGTMTLPAPATSAREESAESSDSASNSEASDAPPTREELGTFGMIGLLAEHQGTDASPWVSVPHDGSSSMWGDAIGDAKGIGGIALSGVGEGGGGNALGSVTLDHVHTGMGEGYGVASGHGRLIGHEHNAQTIHCRLTTQTVTCYRMPPEIIQRVVRANEGRFRACYEDGLRRNPQLAGRVTTRFVISRDGSVASAADGGSDLADPEVLECVQRAFTSLEFPGSPDGIATVVYPIAMQPD